ncbi:hypothetical protein GCM10028778_17810 [Barrientosiimonas marina]|uniref:Quinate/shikimate 5-dehydrogenase/glutamyl-tRNA reductase domain-containing protein n=1 Tax=Lentibacillus kimchii TaxID=1542911 RepID=A0ABW2UTX8_9BACI
MGVTEQLHDELNAISGSQHTAVTINSTARAGNDFLVLPRRYTKDTAIAGFLIDREDLLRETLDVFDGQVDTIYVDIEQKKEISLFQTAKQMLQHSRLEALKPNDMAVEACDMLIRQQFGDDVENRRIVIIGTGNLASKITLRLSERQARVYMLGRSRTKEQNVIDGLNTFVPAYSAPVRSFSELPDDGQPAAAVIAFIIGQFQEEARLLPYIGPETFLVDGGINNFSGQLIQQLTARGLTVTRLDVRLGLPYQLMAADNYITEFFRDVFGKTEISGITLVAGGFIGEAGSVIVDSITRPGQIVGIADGKGGVKRHEHLTAADEEAIRTIRDAFSVSL